MPVGVEMVEEGEGGTDWKAWIGRASKNSWANMKGVLEGSDRLVGGLGWVREGGTIGDKADVFTPCYWEACVFGRASISDIDFLEGSVTAEELALRFS